VFDNLISVLTKAAASGVTVDVKNLYVLFSFDCVCEAAFGYDLQAVNGSLEGKMLHDSLQSLADLQAGQGVYPAPNARVVPPEEVFIIYVLRFASHCILFRFGSYCTSHRIASHRIASHRIASHRIAPHRIALR
jgi:hypothetical protein